MSNTRRATRRTKTAPDLPPVLPPFTETRNMELIGLDEDGNMALWDVGNVRPVTAFEDNGPWIKGGHFVIQWKGHAITVHCSSSTVGMVEVLFMCSRNWHEYLPHAAVEAMLLGEVVRDPEAEARMNKLFEQLEKTLHARAHAPERRRGRI